MKNSNCFSELWRKCICVLFGVDEDELFRVCVGFFLSSFLPSPQSAHAVWSALKLIPINCRGVGHVLAGGLSCRGRLGYTWSGGNHQPESSFILNCGE